MGQFHPLETPRLYLRGFIPGDAEIYHRRISSDPQVAEYMLWNAQDDLEKTKAHLQRIAENYGRPGFYRWAVTLRETGELIGSIGLHTGEEPETGSFAYMLARGFWGRGYAAEALAAVLDFGFREAGLACIRANHFARNRASGRVMEKAGLRRVGFCPSKYEKNGVSYDAVLYEIKREEFLQRQTAPENPVPG